MLSFITTVSSTASIRLFTFLHGKKVGTDEFGNTYYCGKPRRQSKRERRWVLYHGKADPTTIPAEWHGWIHHQTNAIPQESNPLRPAWQTSPTPNATGTDAAYRPSGHPAKGGQRERATGDYQAWTPTNHQAS